jgi:hypothetical protein
VQEVDLFVLLLGWLFQQPAARAPHLPRLLSSLSLEPDLLHLARLARHCPAIRHAPSLFHASRQPLAELPAARQQQMRESLDESALLAGASGASLRRVSSGLLTGEEALGSVDGAIWSACVTPGVENIL